MFVMLRSVLTLIAAVTLSGCGSPASPLSDLEDPSRLPPTVRSNPSGFCDAALAQAAIVAPNLDTTAGVNFIAGEHPHNSRVTCAFPTDEAALFVVFEAVCADVSNAQCVGLLAVSNGVQGWTAPEYEQVMRDELSSGSRLQVAPAANENR
jgi:hypothetical protein